MSVKLKHSKSGAVVSVSAETAARLGGEWKPVETKTAAAKKSPAKKATKKSATKQ